MPSPTPVTPIVPAKTRKEIVLERIQEILRAHDGLESNIPATKDHEYWGLVNEYRALSR